MNPRNLFIYLIQIITIALIILSILSCNQPYYDSKYQKQLYIPLSTKTFKDKPYFGFSISIHSKWSDCRSIEGIDFNGFIPPPELHAITKIRELRIIVFHANGTSYAEDTFYIRRDSDYRSSDGTRSGSTDYNWVTQMKSNTDVERIILYSNYRDAIVKDIRPKRFDNNTPSIHPVFILWKTSEELEILPSIQNDLSINAAYRLYGDKDWSLSVPAFRKIKGRKLQIYYNWVHNRTFRVGENMIEADFTNFN